MVKRLLEPGLQP